ncbi:MAG TPA: class I SAM-dependent methyltransferase [Iamia sp.]|nr:class I SAM-dependent methyltransferase [Iamia sp.]
MTSRSGAQEVLGRLRAEGPRFAPGPAGPHDRPPSPVLEWLVGEVPLGGTALEVGCGWSTIALGLVVDRLVTVSPDPDEHEAVRRWAKEHEIALDTVELVAAHSEHHLPAATADGTLAPGTFDLVLVDGDHAAPIPALDVHHAGPLLRPGGLLVLERARIRAVADVAHRLRADTAGWSVRHAVGDAVVLQRRAGAPAGPARWWEQPGNDEPPSLEDRARALLHRVREARR